MPKQSDRSSSTTTLAGTLNNQPWNNYSFGLGINAESGALALQGVNPIEVERGGSQNTNQSYSVISTDDEYQSLFAAEAEGAYNMGSTSATASSSYMKYVTYSDTSLTVVAIYEVSDALYATPTKDPSLTPAAQALANSNPASFRNSYGDYFVETAQYGSRFMATYTCSAASITSLQNFKASASGKYDMFSASGSTEFAENAASNNISIEIQVETVGMTGALPPLSNDPSSVLNALNTFVTNMAPTPIRARLVHYAELDASIPMVLQVDPDNFSLIQTAAFQLQELDSTISSLPDYYLTTSYALDPPVSGVNTVGDAQNYLTNQFNANLGSLPTDPTKTQYFSEQISNLTLSLKPSLALYSFYLSLTNSPPSGPGSGTYSQVVGMSGSELPNVLISSDFDNYSEKGHVGHRSHTFSFPFTTSETSCTITGWYIHNVWSSSSNGSWETGGPMIGTAGGSMHVRSKYDHGCDWSWYVYFVPNSTFPWLGSS